MPVEVLHQIQYLCKKISKVEWSGALFYTTEGSIENPETFKITLKTILPLDMGSQAYTEYSLDDRFMDFIEEDFEERCTWKLGHIHSHNSMAVFFSGTDMAELNDNAPAHNFYLSLIVNNAMDFLAKVAFIGEAKKDIKQVPYTAKNVQGHDYVIETQDFEVNTQKLFIFDCEMQTPLVQEVVDETFAAQVAKIMEPKPVKTFPKNDWAKYNTGTGGGNNWSRTTTQQPEKPIKRWFDDWKEPEEELVQDFGALNEEDEHAIEICEFAKDLFGSSVEHTPNEDYLEDVLDELAEFNLTPQEIAKTVINDYAPKFAKHFPKASSVDFVQYTHELTDLLEDMLVIYPEIRLTVTTITSMINKFIENERNKQSTK